MFNTNFNVIYTYKNISTIGRKLKINYLRSSLLPYINFNTVLFCEVLVINFYVKLIRLSAKLSKIYHLSH